MPPASGNFYPRPPRGGRPHCMWIRACFLRFLSTPSARRATSASASTVPRAEISIHALREEGDTSNRDTLTWVAYFYPRPPRGGRPTAGGLDLLGQGFLSTPSARRATGPHCVVEAAGYYFYPRPPRGGRRAGCPPGLSLSRFLSTPSARRATSERRHWHIGQSLFLSTPSARRATGSGMAG